MLVVLAALVAGCGGEDAETTASSASTSPAPKPAATAPVADPLPKAKFVALADRLCERSRRADERKAVAVFRSKAKLYEKNGTIEGFRGSLWRQEIAIVLAPSLRGRLGEVRALGIPKGDERRVEGILRTADAAAQAALENPAAFLESGSPLKEARDLARAYGIESCAVLYDPDGSFRGLLPSRGSA